MQEEKEITLKYKPFDLQKALAGDKFVREYDLASPSEWHYFKDVNDIACTFSNEIDIAKYSSFGERYQYGVDHRLIMLPKTKKLWIALFKNIYYFDMKSFHASNAYESLDALREHVDNTENDIEIIEIEAEE